MPQPHDPRRGAIIPLALGLAVLPPSLAQTDAPSTGASDWHRGSARSGSRAPGARSREGGRTVLSENLRVRAVFDFYLLDFHDFRRNGDGKTHSSRISASENRSGTEVFVEELGEVLGPGEVPAAAPEISGNGVAQQGPRPRAGGPTSSQFDLYVREVFRAVSPPLPAIPHKGDGIVQSLCVRMALNRTSVEAKF